MLSGIPPDKKVPFDSAQGDFFDNWNTLRQAQCDDNNWVAHPLEWVSVQLPEVKTSDQFDCPYRYLKTVREGFLTAQKIII
ncbi:MAG: hypothetical protein DWP97_00555 [Calditrichaeota bacterium]|nr:MAG: hypothetical protein DWP97_00555 [Calditrichota bacterium]